MEYGKDNEFHVSKSIVLLFSSKINSLVKNDAMLNTITMNNVAIKSVDGDFGQVHYRQERQICI